ncbi:hypothetical protein DUNSADRAFT_7584 [Dunaliella salina]|uniref:Uncharacterized protein n=1 Tax=Dunaliella salina TaxID=3046 RepID=A0ABQ7GL19_DUNSA|nr:hypothetical protein DUNSADRAFT_7584 [Dunaliella salina]|eukprot:KAF5835305.1 hypothetical protein DUNSADRAFT_7584 [Dunaliella salina]
MLADPLGYVLDSKPYLAPILTPYEALLALTGRSLPFDEPYVLDLRCLAEADASEVEASRAAEAEEAPGALVASGRGQVARLQGAGGQQLSANNAAEYLQLVRSFKGLEAPVAGAAPKAPTAAVEGQRGRAAVYRDEGLQ